MLDMLQKRRDDEEGFTLIELMVVVLIIAILLAIAIPTFLGARNRANDRAAQSSLRNALTAAKVLFTDAQDYTVADTAALGDEEPAIVFGTASTGPKEVAVDDAILTASEWFGGAYSKSGKCFYIKDNSAAVSAGGDGTTFLEEANTTGTCGAQSTGTYTKDGWD